MILAAGLGTRMRRPAAGVTLTAEQERAAATGIKTLIPIAGQTLLDRLVAALAAVGVAEICVVVGPAHRPLVEHCRRLAAGGRAVTTAVQPAPRGTADALLAAESFAAGRPFLMLNSDNLYAAADLARLAALGGAGLLAVARRRALAAGLADEKLRAWAVVESDHRGCLAGLVEKPDPAVWRGLAEPVLLSTNAWRFGPEIFAACRRVAPSPRGELELPAAVLDAIARRPGFCVRILEAEEAVLDLSERADVAALEARWGGGGG